MTIIRSLAEKERNHAKQRLQDSQTLTDCTNPEPASLRLYYEVVSQVNCIPAGSALLPFC